MISWRRSGCSVPTGRERRSVATSLLILCARRLWLHLYAGPKTKLLIALCNPEALAVWCCAYKVLSVCLFQSYIIHTKLITCGCPGLLNAKSTGWCRHLCRPGCDRPINISGITEGLSLSSHCWCCKKPSGAWSAAVRRVPAEWCGWGLGLRCSALPLEFWLVKLGICDCQQHKAWPHSSPMTFPGPELLSADLHIQFPSHLWCLVTAVTWVSWCSSRAASFLLHQKLFRNSHLVLTVHCGCKHCGYLPLSAWSVEFYSPVSLYSLGSNMR